MRSSSDSLPATGSLDGHVDDIERATNVRRRAFLALGIPAAVGALGWRSASPAVAHSDGSGTGTIRPRVGPVDMSRLQSFAGLYGANPPAPMLVIDRPVLLDVDATVKGMEIVPGGRLVFPAAQSRILTLDGRALCVDGGRLEAAPMSAAVTHRIRFKNINESAFTAGGNAMDHKRDPGLCAMTGGVIDLRGTPKTAWSFAIGALSIGQTRIRVTAAAGWRVGDRLVIAPTAPVTTSDHSLRYDDVLISAVIGNTITLARPLSNSHPVNTSPSGEVFPPEVMNMTRNVVVEGDTSVGPNAGRAHIMLMPGGHAAHTFSYVAIRHMGPRQPGRTVGSKDPTVLVSGRYGLHFHRMGDDSRGSLVEGVVASELGTRAFVPHASNGVTFRDCIAHSYFEDGYWWDVDDNSIDASNDITYERCVASLGKSDPDYRGVTISGFLMAAGTNLSAIGCRSFGIQGKANASGFQWPSKTNKSPNNLWTFTDCVSHNNRGVGTFVWHNDPNRHVITRLRTFNCQTGIDHGAYRNAYVYDDAQSWGNRDLDLDLHAASHQATNGQRLSFLGGSARSVNLSDHGLPSLATAVLRDINVDSVTIADSKKRPGTYDFINTGLLPTGVVRQRMHPATVVRIQTGDKAWLITSRRVAVIAPFA